MTRSATTLCWAAKGGSGTTVVTAAMGLTARRPVLLVDLAGDLPAVLGLDEPVGPGIHDWIIADAGADRIDDLVVAVTDGIDLVPAGTGCAAADDPRWGELADALAHRTGSVLIDAGTGAPPPLLRTGVDRTLLVTRACYVALRRAVTQTGRPNGVVFVEEPGRALRATDVESAIGAPIVATLTIDPAVARAVDAGLLATRLPRAIQRELERAA